MHSINLRRPHALFAAFVFWFFAPSLAHAQSAPVITAQPQSQVVNLRATVSFSVSATGTLPLYYQWFFNGTLLPGATGSTLSLGSVTNDFAGTYSVAVSNGIGGVTSESATLSIVQVPEILGPAPQVAYVGMPYRYAIASNNFPSVYAVSGLPPGLAVNAASGVIAGTPTVAGSYAVNVNAANAQGVSGAVVFTIQVSGTPVVFSALAGKAGQSGGADGTGEAASFAAPDGVAVDGAGNVYVADTGNITIRKITPAGVVTTLAGGSLQTGYVDGPGNVARFNHPTGIAADSAGNVYVADTNNQLIRKISTGGVVSTYAGVYGQIGSNDGPAGNARFNSPQGVAVDSSGNVYVADTLNSTIRRISPAGIVTTVAGAAGQTGLVDASGAAARFWVPTSVAVDPSGSILVIDTANFAVRKIAPSGAVTTVASNLFVFSGHIKTAPRRIAVDAGENIYLSAGPDLTYRIWKLSASGALETYVAWYTSGSAYIPGPPTGIASDPNGNLVVATGNVSSVRDLTPLAILAQPQSQHAAPGHAVTFGAVASVPVLPAPYAVTGSGAITPTYQWLANGMAISPGLNASAATSALTVTAGIADTAYTVVISNSYGSVESAPAVLTVDLPAGPAPTIASQPVSVAVAVGNPVALYAGVAGSGAAYQWRKNGVAIPGANSATLILPKAGAADAGSYSVVVARSGGTVESDPATLTVNAPTTAQTQTSSRLSALSVRSFAGTNENTLISGLAIAGSAAKTVVIRGVGPGLKGFGVSGLMDDPQLRVFDQSGTQIQMNDDWGGVTALSNIFASVGLAPLSATSKDSAQLLTLNPGTFTTQLTTAGNSGIALMEVYDAGTATDGARLSGLAVRSSVGTGQNVLIVGFVISGNTPKQLVIRGLGPALSASNVPGVLADPQLGIYVSGGAQIRTNDNWGGDPALSSAFAAAGLSALPSDSKDAALLVTLDPGVYTVQLSGVASTTGVGLIELYEVP